MPDISNVVVFLPKKGGSDVRRKGKEKRIPTADFGLLTSGELNKPLHLRSRTLFPCYSSSAPTAVLLFLFGPQKMTSDNIVAKKSYFSPLLFCSCWQTDEKEENPTFADKLQLGSKEQKIEKKWRS